VHADLDYSTVIVKRHPGDLGGADFVVALEPPAGLRGAFVLPIEHGRWVVSLTGWHGDHPGSDYDSYLSFARSLPVPHVAALLERNGPVHATTHRLPSSQWRHVERWRRPAAGHLLLGDAICSFNPIYGQGMSSTALQADELATTLARYELRSRRLPRTFYQHAARIVAAPWTVAVWLSPDCDVYIDAIHEFLARHSLAIPGAAAGDGFRSLWDPYDSLTPGERRCVRLAQRGLTNAAIADSLGLSVRTGETTFRERSASSACAPASSWRCSTKVRRPNRAPARQQVDVRPPTLWTP
jgi:hypothetical protein